MTQFCVSDVTHLLLHMQ